MNKKSNETGSTHLVIIVGVVVIALVAFLGWRTLSGQKDTSSNQSSSKAVTWSFENDAWKASTTPPACPTPLLASPVDMSTATSILYPGQTRGIYKAHGGFRFDNNKDNNVDVKVAIDAKLIRVARYIQTDQIQYMLDFESPCGVAIRYDHLLTLTKPFMDIMNKLPAPKVNDSRTTDIQDDTIYPVGTLIATQVGFLAPAQGTTLDFGVYDYRKSNEASKDPTYAAAHKNSNATDYYATCWLDDFSAKDNAIAASLPGGDGKAGKTSDYCK